MGGVSARLRQLVRVGLQIEQLLGIERALVYFQRPAQGDQRRDRAFGGVFHRTGLSAFAPPHHRHRLSPSVQGMTSAIDTPARSHSVGQTSSVETGGCRPARAQIPGAAIISGTRAEPSKKLILNHKPRSPSMSPWSETKR
jgi:hypothetical protein